VIGACPDCLARGILLRDLAARIDRAVDRRAGERARDLLALDSNELAAAVGGGSLEAPAAIEAAASPEARAALEEDLEAAGCSVVCRHRSGWPDGFDRLGPAAPAALYMRGNVGLLERLDGERTATIVGARRAGPYGREVAHSLAAELAAAGIVVISGLAFGIDTSAHEGALAGGGVTVAVLGAGPERPYPRARARLHRRVAESGLVISELPPGSPTFRWTFPARNRLMAALAAMTVVVEAAERSGSLITAEMAGDCGRVVGAVPGPVNSWRSAGTNLLLADGARLVRDGADVLEELLGPGALAKRTEPAGPPLEPRELAVLDACEGGARTPDALVLACGLSADEAAVSLSRLELCGYVVREPAGSYARTALPAPGASCSPIA
jgi:DNA processing protein